MAGFSLFEWLKRKNKSKKNKRAKTKSSIKKSRSLTESPAGANLPSKAEAGALKAVERRLAALEKKNNPKYKAEYVPFYDPVEAKEDEVRNTRYQKISGRYRALKWAVFFVFGLFCVFMVFTFSEEITVENFRYMMRSIDFEADTGAQISNDIVYVAEEDNIFLAYRDYLALLNGKGLTVYDTAGSVAHSEKLSYGMPSMSVSDKYLLVYDKAGGDYSVYTYFAREHSESLDYPVLKASVSDSGIYALATRTKDHVGAVYIYNGSFKLMNRILKNKYVSAIDLTDSGDEVIVCAYSVDERGGTVSEITLLPTSTQESRLTFTLDGVMVYECTYLENGGFVLVCSDGLRFYDRQGNITAFVSYNDGKVEKFITQPSGVLLVLSHSDSPDSTSAVYYGADGKEMKRLAFSGNIIDISWQADYVYTLYADRLIRTDIETGASQIHTVERNRVATAIATGRNGAYVCTAGMAYMPVWEDEKSSKN